MTFGVTLRRRSVHTDVCLIQSVTMPLSRRQRDGEDPDSDESPRLVERRRRLAESQGKSRRAKTQLRVGGRFVKDPAYTSRADLRIMRAKAKAAKRQSSPSSDAVSEKSDEEEQSHTPRPAAISLDAEARDSTRLGNGEMQNRPTGVQPPVSPARPLLEAGAAFFGQLLRTPMMAANTLAEAVETRLSPDRAGPTGISLSGRNAQSERVGVHRVFVRHGCSRHFDASHPDRPCGETCPCCRTHHGHLDGGCTQCILDKVNKGPEPVQLPGPFQVRPTIASPATPSFNVRDALSPGVSSPAPQPAREDERQAINKALTEDVDRLTGDVRALRRITDAKHKDVVQMEQQMLLAEEKRRVAEENLLEMKAELEMKLRRSEAENQLLREAPSFPVGGQDSEIPGYKKGSKDSVLPGYSKGGKDSAIPGYAKGTLGPRFHQGVRRGDIGQTGAEVWKPTLRVSSEAGKPGKMGPKGTNKGEAWMPGKDGKGPEAEPVSPPSQDPAAAARAARAREAARQALLRQRELRQRQIEEDDDCAELDEYEDDYFPYSYEEDDEYFNELYADEHGFFSDDVEGDYFIDGDGNQYFVADQEALFKDAQQNQDAPETPKSEVPSQTGKGVGHGVFDPDESAPAEEETSFSASPDQTGKDWSSYQTGWGRRGRKTFCRYYTWGSCSKGDNCPDLHCEKDASSQSDVESIKSSTPGKGRGRSAPPPSQPKGKKDHGKDFSSNRGSDDGKGPGRSASWGASAHWGASSARKPSGIENQLERLAILVNDGFSKGAPGKGWQSKGWQTKDDPRPGFDDAGVSDKALLNQGTCEWKIRPMNKTVITDEKRLDRWEDFKNDLKMTLGVVFAQDGLGYDVWDIIDDCVTKSLKEFFAATDTYEREQVWPDAQLSRNQRIVAYKLWDLSHKCFPQEIIDELNERVTFEAAKPKVECALFMLGQLCLPEGFKERESIRKYALTRHHLLNKNSSFKINMNRWRRDVLRLERNGIINPKDPENHYRDIFDVFAADMKKVGASIVNGNCDDFGDEMKKLHRELVIPDREKVSRDFVFKYCNDVYRIYLDITKRGKERYNWGVSRGTAMFVPQFAGFAPKHVGPGAMPRHPAASGQRARFAARDAIAKRKGGAKVHYTEGVDGEDNDDTGYEEWYGDNGEQYEQDGQDEEYCQYDQDDYDEHGQYLWEQEQECNLIYGDTDQEGVQEDEYCDDTDACDEDCPCDLQAFLAAIHSTQSGKCRCEDPECKRPDNRCIHVGQGKVCNHCKREGHDQEVCYMPHPTTGKVLRPELRPKSSASKGKKSFQTQKPPKGKKKGKEGKGHTGAPKGDHKGGKKGKGKGGGKGKGKGKGKSKGKPKPSVHFAGAEAGETQEGESPEDWSYDEWYDDQTENEHFTEGTGGYPSDHP